MSEMLENAASLAGVLGFLMGLYLLLRDGRPIAYFETRESMGVVRLHLIISHTNKYPLLVESSSAYKLTFPRPAKINAYLSCDGWETIDVIRSGLEDRGSLSVTVNRLAKPNEILSLNTDIGNLPNKTLLFLIFWNKPGIFFFLSIPIIRFLSVKRRQQLAFAPLREVGI
jgi:hypothetical protein